MIWNDVRRTGRGLVLLAAMGGYGCTPGGDGDGGGGSGGGGGGSDGGVPPAVGEVFGAATGTWDVTFDSGAFAGMTVSLGGGEDGRSVVVRTEGAPHRISYGARDADGEVGCRAASDEVHLRATEGGREMFGHAYTRYRCGPMQPDESFFDVRDWGDDRFDRESVTASGSALAWKVEGGEGDHGIINGEWRIEAPYMFCQLRVSPDAELAGGCEDARPWGSQQGIFEATGRLDGGMASGTIDDLNDFAAQRVGDPEADPALPVGDPLGGASGRWHIWGSQGSSGLDTGAVLDLDADGTAVTASMRWNDREAYQPDFGATVSVEQTLAVALDVADGAAGGSATWFAEASVEGEVWYELTETFTATRLDEAPAAIPLLGGEWLLVPDGDPGRMIPITLDGEALTVTLPGFRDQTFTGHLDPRQVTGVGQVDADFTRYGGSWVSGRRVAD